MARQNKKTWQDLVEQVKQIGDLLRSLEEQPGVGMAVPAGDERPSQGAARDAPAGVHGR
jgi:hypothetical protein